MRGTARKPTPNGSGELEKAPRVALSSAIPTNPPRLRVVAAGYHVGLLARHLGAARQPKAAPARSQASGGQKLRTLRGFLGEADPGRRPVREEDLPDQILARDGAPAAGVAGLPAGVAPEEGLPPRPRPPAGAGFPVPP